MSSLGNGVRLLARQRWAWEALGALLCLAALAGAWSWGERRTASALAVQARAAEEKLAAARRDGEQWSETLAASEAQATFRAFVAALHPAVLSQRTDDIDAAVGAVLQLPGVAFVHVFRPDGSVLSSSDRKLMTTRKMGEDAGWALGTAGLETRAGILPGTIEIAAPIQAAAGRMAVVWMGYKTDATRARTRPAESR